MKFLVQLMGSPTPEERVAADALRDLVQEGEFDSPAHLRAWLEEHMSALIPNASVAQHHGITNVHGPRGIVARIRSLN